MSIGLRSLRIDVIRGVAILLVLLHHFNIAYRLDDTLLAGALGWDRNVSTTLIHRGW